jgi:hypothetical protein
MLAGKVFYKSLVVARVSICSVGHKYFLLPIKTITMAIQLIEVVQQRLGLPALIKITPAKTEPEKELPKAPLHQVALVAVAGALYRITRTNEGCVRLLLSGKTASWLSLEEAYGSRLPEVIRKISDYGVADVVATEKLINDIAQTHMLVIHEELAGSISTDTIREFMSAQRHNILIYVPTDLQLGKLLNDRVLDDETNHMEGPISNVMHKIEDLFS